MFSGLAKTLAISAIVINVHLFAVETPPPDAATQPVVPPPNTEASSSTAMLPQKLTLTEAKQLALRGNPDLLVTEARIQAAAARIKEADAAYMPSLDFVFDGKRQINTAAPEKGIAHKDAYGAFNTQLQGSYTLYDGLSRRHALIISEFEKQIADLNHENAQRKLLLAVATAYFQAMLERQNVIINIDDFDYNKRLQDNAEKKLRHGTGTRSDVLNFEIQAKNAEGERLLSELNFRISILALAELLGITPAQIPDNLELDAIRDYQKASQLPDYKSLCDYAFNHRPDLEAADLAIKVQSERTEAARSNYQPTISLYGTYGFNRYHDLEYRNENTGATIGLQLSWNVFNGGSTQAKVMEAVAGRLENEAAKKTLSQSILHEIARQLRTIDQAKQLADLKNETQTLAMQARDLVQKEYDIGKVTATRLNEAQNDLTNAQGAYAKAVINYWLYRQNLEATTGYILEIK